MDPISKAEKRNGSNALIESTVSKDEESLGEETAAEVKVDKYGLPLVPQPSDSPDDPLVRSTSSPTNNN
jgi:hypothetical protein